MISAKWKTKLFALNIIFRNDLKDKIVGSSFTCVVKSLRCDLEGETQVDRSGHRISQKRCGKIIEFCGKTRGKAGIWKQYSGREFFGFFSDDFRTVLSESTVSYRNLPEKIWKILGRNTAFTFLVFFVVFRPFPSCVVHLDRENLWCFSAGSSANMIRILQEHFRPNPEKNL